MQLYLNALPNLNRIKKQHAKFPFKSLMWNNSLQTLIFIIFGGGINYRFTFEIFLHLKTLFFLLNLKSKIKPIKTPKPQTTHLKMLMLVFHIGNEHIVNRGGKKSLDDLVFTFWMGHGVCGGETLWETINLRCQEHKRYFWVGRRYQYNSIQARALPWNSREATFNVTLPHVQHT